jgi:hypothetical protein
MTDTTGAERLFVRDLAARWNLAQSTIHRYRRRPEMRFPEPDGHAVISGGRAPWWYATTVDVWFASRPGPGTRTDLTNR